MLSLHKKKRVVLTTLVVVAVALPAITFVINKFAATNNTFAAVTYEMPEGYTSIVDPNFYDCVAATFIRDFKNPDEEIPATGLTDEQLDRIDTLVCNDRTDGDMITNATGLNKMTRMYYLDLSSNALTSIDLSTNTALNTLYIHSNQLTSLDVSNSSVIRNIDVHNNQIQSINLANATNLRTLDAHSNQIEEINLTQNTALRIVKLNFNQLTSLDVTHNTALTLLNVDGNNIASLNLANNNNLADLMTDNIPVDTGVIPTISGGNYTYDFSGLEYITDGNHEGYVVDFSIADQPGAYSYNEANMVLTVTNPVAAGDYVQVVGDDDKDEGGFSFTIQLPRVLDLNVNGGNGTVELQICQVGNDNGGTKALTQGCTVTIPTVTLSKDGYTFSGWAESSTATAAQYHNGDEVLLNGNMTLYAVWTLNSETVNLNFDLNGVEGASVAAQDCTINATVTTCNVTIPNTTPSRDGYFFLGWADSASATSAAYQPGGNATISTDTTFYAIWAPVRTLSYDGNGGGQVPGVDTCHANDTTSGCNISATAAEPEREGYNFLGWADSSTATSAAYHGGDTITLSASKTIYAVWQIVVSNISLGFNLGGGEGTVASQPCSIDVEHPTCDVTIPNTTPSRNGYNFLGWADSATATSAAYHGGDPLTLSGNKTIYAVWELITTTVTLSLNLNGVEGVGIAGQECTISVENPTCNVTIPDDPPREGYRLLGWADSADATEPVYVSGDTVVMSEDKTIYAIWAEIQEEDETDDEEEVPVPNTGENSMIDGGGVVFTVAILPAIIALVCAISYHYSKKD